SPSLRRPARRARSCRACARGHRHARTACALPKPARSSFLHLRIVGLTGHAERRLAEAFTRPPARGLEHHVVPAAAGIVGNVSAWILDERFTRMRGMPARHQLGRRAIPRPLEDPCLERLRAVSLVLDGWPELVGVLDVLLPVEEPHLVALDVAEDEEPP